MFDSGSRPNVANCHTEFPGHQIRESEGQKVGLLYKGANGALIPNEGEVDVVHREPDGQLYPLTIQHADVHCIMLSVREFVTQDCRVTFHKKGGHIRYPDGRRIRFVIREGVFFVSLNVLPPNFRDVFGNKITDGQGRLTSGFSRHGQP